MSSSAGKIRGDATSNYRPSAGVVCCRVYRFNRVGREKHAVRRHDYKRPQRVRTTRVVRVSRHFFSRVPRRQKMWNTNFPPLQPPYVARPPATRGRCRAEQWWSFIVSLVSSKRMTCSSAMYSDTATLTLKYHIWRITIRHARCLEKLFDEPPQRGRFHRIEIRRTEMLAISRFPFRNSRTGNARGSEISISRREKFVTPPT